MAQFGCRCKGLLALGVVMLAGVSEAAAANEVRDFAVLVDGKKAGYYRMTVQDQGDGAVSMTGQAEIAVRYLVYTYKYSYTGTESWKDGRLQTFRSATNDNGKRFQVTAAAEGNHLRVRVNGRERLARGDAWLTSYWRLPPAKFRNAAVPLIDADTSRDINGRLQYIGPEQVNVAGQVLNCSHYRVTGGPYPVDLWYDGQERLAQQSFVEQGHRTVLQVAAIRR